MKKTLLVGAACLSLAGCGAVQNAQLKSSVQQAEREIAEKCPSYLSLAPEEVAAWNSIKDAPKLCGGDSEPWPREKTKEISSCIGNYLEKNIKPVSYSPKGFSKLMSDRADEHNKYAAGVISWGELSELGNKRLGVYFTKGNSGSYFNFVSCSHDILNRKVFPVYEHKPLLTEYMANSSAFARAADKKKMAREDFLIGMQKLWSEFTLKEQSYIQGLQAQHAAAWQNWAQQSAQTLREMENAQRSNTTTTTCHEWGSGFRCETE